MKTIWFDMDGTIYDLYKIPGWLGYLCRHDWSVFSEPMPRHNWRRINEAVAALSAQGWRVGVITWAPKGVAFESQDFAEVFETKFRWLQQFFPTLADGCFICVPYGEDKTEKVQSLGLLGEVNYLVDDNKAVRKMWRERSKDFESRKFKTINATRAFVRELESMTGGI